MSMRKFGTIGEIAKRASTVCLIALAAAFCPGAADAVAAPPEIEATIDAFSIKHGNAPVLVARCRLPVQTDVTDIQWVVTRGEGDDAVDVEAGKIDGVKEKSSAAILIREAGKGRYSITVVGTTADAKEFAGTTTGVFEGGQFVVVEPDATTATAPEPKAGAQAAGADKPKAIKKKASPSSVAKKGVWLAGSEKPDWSFNVHLDLEGTPELLSVKLENEIGRDELREKDLLPVTGGKEYQATVASRIRVPGATKVVVRYRVWQGAIEKSLPAEQKPKYTTRHFTVSFDDKGTGRIVDGRGESPPAPPTAGSAFDLGTTAGAAPPAVVNNEENVEFKLDDFIVETYQSRRARPNYDHDRQTTATDLSKFFADLASNADAKDAEKLGAAESGAAIVAYQKKINEFAQNLYNTRTGVRMDWRPILVLLSNRIKTIAGDPKAPTDPTYKGTKLKMDDLAHAKVVFKEISDGFRTIANSEAEQIEEDYRARQEAAAGGFSTSGSSAAFGSGSSTDYGDGCGCRRYRSRRCRCSSLLRI